MGSKYIVSGDLQQSDLRIKSDNGLEDSVKRFTGVYGCGFTQFELSDVVRHPIVSDLLDRYNEFTISDVMLK